MKLALLLSLLLSVAGCSATPPQPWRGEGCIPPTRQADLDAQRPQTPAPANTHAAPALLSATLTLEGRALNHMLPAEQARFWPVPFYIESPPGLTFQRAGLFYKPFGAMTWKRIEMKRLADGLAATIPCEDVTTTGDIKYFFRLDGEEPEEHRYLGSRQEPFRVTIRNELEGGSPALPGQKPQTSCFDRR